MGWQKRAIVFSLGWVAGVIVIGVVGCIVIASRDQTVAKAPQPLPTPQVPQAFAKSLPKVPGSPPVVPLDGPSSPVFAGKTAGTAMPTTEELYDKIAYRCGMLTGFGVSMIWALSWWHARGWLFFSYKKARR
jgi:hypothetical protein